MLTPAQLLAREGRLTASRVACLMEGDAVKIMRLWQEMVGDPAFVPDDLSSVWPVQLGNATEQLNLDWFERKTGRPVTRRGEVVVGSGDRNWAAATLDGWDASLPGPVEAKHVGGREALSTIIDRYTPQLFWQMLITETKRCALSIIEGANEPIIEVIDLDDDYAKTLWGRAERFMACVRSLVPPVALAPTSAPVRAERIVDMAGNNAFASAAAVWLENRLSKKLADGAEKELKALVPADAAKCFGYGVNIARNRAGSLSLKEDKS